MLFSLCGGIILFSYQNLVTLFLGVEILSIPFYILAGADKTNLRSTEASVKYLLMGAFATGFLLFGVAMVYGSSGTFDLYKIHYFGLQAQGNLMFKLGAIMMLVALSFKVSLAPFHMWSPDVYQGSPSLISVFMMTVVKISAFFGLFRLMTIAFGGIIPEWLQIIGVLVIITLLLANAMGLAQTNAKRMLAYSSVSHAGYIALIFFGITNASIYNLAFYLFAYSIATVGVFLSLIWVEKIKRECSFMAFKGLAKTEPLIAIIATVSLLSMAGVPLTAGFIGKFGIFSQAIVTNPMIVLIAILGSAISIAYYLRLIIAMFFYKETSFNTKEKVSFTYNTVAVVLLIIIISIGVYPDLFKLMFGL
jgi:NADH-quinone oxidoreductase subunit N